ncbi:hypothetical protein ACFOW6_05460 [Fodinicurvata halophila]|uniref:Uncharacterized protein n=1 Tax=Fodinicurvata halophila TaxID=1419723 RepID=A0ABV8UJD9_9PROT
MAEHRGPGKAVHEQRITHGLQLMPLADILAWLLTALATLSACLLGLNLAYSARRINRPKVLASFSGDVVIFFLIFAGLTPVAVTVYSAFLSSLWPVFIIVFGLVLLSAPLFHQVLPESLRNTLQGAIILGIFCLIILVLQFIWLII